MIYRFGAFSLDVDRQELRRGAEAVSVEPRVLDLLQFLLRNRERVVSKDDLIKHVWRGRIVSESTLTSRVAALRQAIDDNGQQQRLVRTIARKGLRFVGDVQEDRGASAEAVSPAAIVVDRPATVPRASERRPLTILHCRIAGLTALAARLEPEDLGEAIAACQDGIRDIVGRHGGGVVKTDGSEVQAFFGHLQANEADAERAVQAGLAIVRAVSQLETGAVVRHLRASVGIATGLVILGPQDGSAGAASAIGETPFLAASLLAAAPPGSVLVSAGTHRLIGSLFDCRCIDLDAGADNKIEAFEVVKPSAVESRFEALDRRSGASLIGRDEELELLTRRWDQAKQGSGRVALIVGEPGIGKSRLVQALRDRTSSEPQMQIVFHCSPHHQASALHPVIGRLLRASGIERDDSVTEKRGKLEALLAQGGESRAEELEVLSALLSIPATATSPPLAATPQRLRERTFVALMSHMRRLAALAPLLVVFEDLHWIDPTSLEMLATMIDQAPAMRLLLIATFRPEFKPPWPSSRHISVTSLGRLDRDEGRTLVAGVTKGKALPRDVLEQILDRTDGVPLYIEELSKSVIESGLLRLAAGGFELTGALTSRAIPSTLHASLVARLDRLGPVREVAQIGAAIGRRFSFDQIAAVAGLSGTELAAGLGELVAAELIFQRGVPPDATYQFKHALVQEAAYASLLRGRRQQLHRDIAAALEQRFPEIATTEPEALAHHLTEAGSADAAVGYWLKAGQRAAERSADREALSHLLRGLSLLRTLRESTERDRVELDFQITLGTPLSSVHGYASEQVAAAAERATILAERLSDATSLFAPLYAHYTNLYITGHTGRAVEVAQRLQTLGARQNDRVMQMMASRAMGIASCQIGDFTTGLQHFEKALSRYDRARDGSLAARYLTDPFASTSSLCSIVLWISGYPERAARMRDQALDFAASLHHVHTSGLVHHFGAHLAGLSGNPAGVLDHTRAMRQLASQHNVDAWRSHWTIWEGWAHARTGERDRGIALMQEGIAGHNGRNLNYHVAYYIALLAQLHAAGGDHQQALALCQEARQRVSSTAEAYWSAELHRTEGELRRAAGGAPSEIEACFRTAIELSRTQGARMFELRAAASLARLYLDLGQGRSAEARDLIAPRYAWFTEGFDTIDLKDARALLDRLDS